MDPDFLHPPIGLGIVDQVEEPAQESSPVSAPKAKSSGVRRKRVGKRAGIVEDAFDRVRHDLGNRLRVLTVAEEI